MLNPQELLFTVDKNNNPIEPQPRDKVHKEGIWHRTSHVWVMNQSGNILTQQRSLKKDTSPGKWEPFFGGHIPPNKSYIESAIEELNEELGLQANEQDLTFITEFKNNRGKEFTHVFLYYQDIDIDQIEIEEDEIEKIVWNDIQTIHKQVADPIKYNLSIIGYEQEVLTFIENFLTRKNKG